MFLSILYSSLAIVVGTFVFFASIAEKPRAYERAMVVALDCFQRAKRRGLSSCNSVRVSGMHS